MSPWRAGIAPFRPAKSLGREEILRLHQAIREVLTDAVHQEEQRLGLCAGSGSMTIWFPFRLMAVRSLASSVHKSRTFRSSSKDYGLVSGCQSV